MAQWCAGKHVIVVQGGSIGEKQAGIISAGLKEAGARGTTVKPKLLNRCRGQGATHVVVQPNGYEHAPMSNAADAANPGVARAYKTS